MANTNKLKSHIEPYVRKWLSSRFGTSFSKMQLPLSQVGADHGQHEFDAVSEDRSIVAGIKSSSGKTTGGNSPDGKKKGAYSELYFLSLVEANRKLLVLTDQEFFDLFTKDSQGKVAAGIEIVHCPLPTDLQTVVRDIREEASAEINRGKRKP